MPHIRVADDRANLVIQSAAFQSLLITSYDVWPRDMLIKYIPAALLIFQGDSQIRNSYVVLFHISEVLKCTVFPLDNYITDIFWYYRYFIYKFYYKRLSSFLRLYFNFNVMRSYTNSNFWRDLCSDITLLECLSEITVPDGLATLDPSRHFYAD